MKNDSQEMAQVARLGMPRLDLYCGIHKALRALMADTLLALGRMDPHDAPELHQTTQRVLELLGFCRSHLAHENEFVHAAIEARAPGASGQIAHEHVEHEQAIEGLSAQALALRDAPAGQRDVLALALYRALALFVAHNFEHMHVEETAHNAVLWSRYTDVELMDIHNRLVASIAPAEMMFTLRWLVPFMNPAERLGLLQDMRAQAPAPAFAAALEVVRPHLSVREWGKLEAGLAAVAAGA